MRVGLDNVFVWVQIVSKRTLEIPGGADSAILRMVGINEEKSQRGTIVTVETTHFPIEAQGRLAIALDKYAKVGTCLWIIGKHREDHYTDRWGEEQHKLKILVQSFEIDRKLDLSNIFRD